MVDVVTLQAYMAYDATAAKFNEKLLVDMGVKMKSNDAKLEGLCKFKEIWLQMKMVIFWGEVKIDALKQVGYKSKREMIILFLAAK